MKKLLSTLAVLTLICTTFLLAADPSKENRPIGDFTEVQVNGAPDVIWSPADKPSLEIDAAPDLIQHIVTEVEGGTLKIMAEENSTSYGPVKIIIHSKSLTSAALFGAGDFSATSLAGDGMEVKLHGSSSVKLMGKVSKLNVLLYGSGDVTAGELATKKSSVSIYGSGDVKLSASDSLVAKVYGSGSVTYSGNAKVDQQVFGSGSIQKQ